MPCSLTFSRLKKVDSRRWFKLSPAFFSNPKLGVRARCAEEYLITPRQCNFFHLTMPNPSFNSLEKRKQPQIRNCCPKETFKDFQNLLKLSVNDANVSSNGDETSRPAISKDETLKILQFYGYRKIYWFFRVVVWSIFICKLSHLTISNLFEFIQVLPFQ